MLNIPIKLLILYVEYNTSFTNINKCWEQNKSILTG